MACGCCKLAALTLVTIAFLAFFIGLHIYRDASSVTVSVQDVKISSLNITQAPEQGFMIASAHFNLIVRVHNPPQRQVEYSDVEITVSYAGTDLAHGHLSSSPFSESPRVSIAFFYPHLSAVDVVLPADAARSLNGSLVPTSAGRGRSIGDDQPAPQVQSLAAERRRNSGKAPALGNIGSLIKLKFHIDASMKMHLRKAMAVSGWSAYECDLYLRAPVVVVQESSDSGQESSRGSRVVKRHCKTLNSFRRNRH